MSDGRPRAWPDVMLAAAAWTAASVVAGLFVWLIADVIVTGIGNISWSFLTEDARDAGRAGGIAPILVSTFLIVLVCMATSIPLGLATAITLSELTRRDGAFATFVRRSLDILAGIPSIVFGLFGYALFCKRLGLGFSILAGGLTLSCMVLPLLIRTTEEGLRAVSNDYRLAAAGLGMSRTTTILQILLPAAMPAVVVATILSLGRALSETAALLFTSGYVDRMPDSVWDSGRSITVHIYDLAINVPGGNTNAYTTALVLVIFLLIINSVTMGLSKRWSRLKQER